MKGNEQFLVSKAPSVRLVVSASEKRIISANKQASILYGYTPEQLKKLSFYDLFPERDQKFLDLKNVHPGQKLIRRNISSQDDEFPVYLKFRKEGSGDSTELICIIDALFDKKTVGQNDISGLVYSHLSKSKLGFIIWNSKLEVIHWSEKIERISGFKFEEVYGRSVFDLDFVDVNERNQFKKILFKALDHQKENFKIKVSIYTKEKEVRRVRLHFSIDWDSNTSTIDSIMCLVEDITSGYQQEQRLKESEKRYRSLFESSSEGVLICKNGIFFDCNRRALELFRCSKDELIGKDPVYFSPEQQPSGRLSADAAMEYISRAQQQGRNSFEWTHRTIEGEDFYTEVHLTKVEIGEESYLQAIIKDITRRKEYEQKLIESEKLFRDLFLNSPTAIVMVDKNNKVELINNSFEDLFGYGFQELKGKELDPFIVSDSDILEAPKMPSIGLDKSDLTREVVRYDKYGKRKNLIVSGIPVYLKGKPFKGFGLYVDITDLKEKEMSIQRSLDEKKVLLGEVHHRVKNNLALISGLLQLQVMKTDDRNIKDVLRESESRIRSIASVHELLYQSSNFSKISSKEYTKAILKQIYSIFDEDVRINISSNEFDININQAIPLGLLINEVLLELTDRKYFEDGKVDISLKQIDSNIEIEIRTNGILIANYHNNEDLSPVLIDALTNQLGATVERSAGDTIFMKIKFPVSEKKGSASAI